MISLLFGLYGAELTPTPSRSYFPSFTKMAFVAGIITCLTVGTYVEGVETANFQFCADQVLKLEANIDKLTKERTEVITQMINHARILDDANSRWYWSDHTYQKIAAKKAKLLMDTHRKTMQALREKLAAEPSCNLRFQKTSPEKEEDL